MQSPENQPSPTSPVTDSSEAPLNGMAQSLQTGAQSVSDLVVELVCRWGLPVWLEPIFSGAILFLALLVLAFLVFFILRPFVKKSVSYVLKKSAFKWDDPFVCSGVARWLSHFLGALIITAVIPGLLGGTPEIARVILILAQIYLVTSGYLIVAAILNGVKQLYEGTDITRKFPVTTLVQVLRLLSFLVALILVVATLAGKSPVVFLSGLGVFTSILMLIFKDSILGFVAGIQLTSNNMVAKGDWIEMPKYGGGRRCPRSRVDHGEGSKLGQDDHHDSHLRSYLRFLQELAVDAGKRWAQDQAFHLRGHEIGETLHR